MGAVATFSKNFLPLLFNAFVGASPEKRGELQVGTGLSALPMVAPFFTNLLGSFSSQFFLPYHPQFFLKLLRFHFTAFPHLCPFLSFSAGCNLSKSLQCSHISSPCSPKIPPTPLVTPHPPTQATIAAFVSISEKAAVRNFFVAVMQKLLQATQDHSTAREKGGKDGMEGGGGHEVVATAAAKRCLHFCPF